MPQEQHALEGFEGSELPPTDNSQDEFIQLNEVDQELAADDAEEPIEEDEDDEDDIPEESLEIDLSNNSVTYFDKHTDSVFTVFHHPSLPLVCSGGGDNVAHLWTSHSQPPKFAGSLETHTESVIAGGFSCDGNFLVTADMTGKVVVHASQKGGSRWKLVSEMQEVEEVIWLKCHPTIPGIFAFGATDGSVWCYQIDQNSGNLEQLMSGFAHQEDCTAGEFINVGQGENVLQLVSAATDGTIIGWNGFTGQQLFKVSKDELKGLETPWVTLSAAPPTGSAAVVACGSNNGVLALINGNNGSVLHLSAVMELQPEQDDIMASVETIAWSKILPVMAVGLVCGNVLIYDTTTWRVRHKIALEDAVTKILFDNENLFVSCINGRVYQFDSRSGEEKYVCLGHNMGVLDFVLVKKDDEDSTRLITAGDEGVSLVFDIPN
ncbi:SQT1 (YIR012W) [Zygosaccharomyces parabailii]|uniref:BN860_02740g1_1 n=1 Tax=Zygosaccharomyces bailii (strain CLIB 213 / ATCC 58445 / CBS 680 / BCRC 21525 / NBRC 1098 / NCYC 1416 / NRRL Y-2227) TaxID=1333698 RepID=A0A8J2X8W1_ZYGB2|nr:SQT1 (YIR012W) [Zygosaccharomyces parabailii]CDF88118.1 BN860_02740g1_1 [Zygosaccharomyces bailii CLIB 213]CDH09052.1 probable Ribosome assembly protein SQT1 [Zygosaccharomyces bailii ISA1307]SJM87428.1 probable Ribosome assembly protein SQT1 [Zygosaccharomyces bailii]